MVKVLPLAETYVETMEKLGFMAGEMAVPDDFGSLGASDIQALFEGDAL